VLTRSTRDKQERQEVQEVSAVAQKKKFVAADMYEVDAVPVRKNNQRPAHAAE
jgi:hypothetical protein